MSAINALRTLQSSVHRVSIIAGTDRVAYRLEPQVQESHGIRRSIAELRASTDRLKAMVGVTKHDVYAKAQVHVGVAHE